MTPGLWGPFMTARSSFSSGVLAARNSDMPEEHHGHDGRLLRF